MKIGLDDVIAAETTLSEVDGSAGTLIIRGHYLDVIAEHKSYEEILLTLFDGMFDTLPAPGNIQRALADARRAVFDDFLDLDERLIELPPIDAVRALIARLDDGSDLATALRLIAAPAVFTAAVIRARQGLSPLAPSLDNDHASDTLRMAGLYASPLHARALSTYLVTIIDHGLNASTFASRVIASTKAGLVSSTLAAISALKGPLHGGAPGPVLDMLDAIGQPARADAWVENAIASGERLMGFGHRIYKVRDPRADALKSALDRLSDSERINRERLNLALAVEQSALNTLKRLKPGRELHTNVEFYTALLLETLGFDRETFTCIFTIGRVGGWIAHAREQALTGRLIRPQSAYVGPQPRRP